MPDPLPTPEQITKALTLRAAASMLPKSPVWSTLVAFMQQRLASLDTTILDNTGLTRDQLHDHRTQRFFLRSLLLDFTMEFRRSFTHPPATDDDDLKRMEVPPEVHQALEALLAHLPPSARPAAAPLPLPQRLDPKPINPFEGDPSSQHKPKPTTPTP